MDGIAEAVARPNFISGQSDSLFPDFVIELAEGWGFSKTEEFVGNIQMWVLDALLCSKLSI